MSNNNMKPWTKEDVFMTLDYVISQDGDVKTYKDMSKNIASDLAIRLHRTVGSVKAIFCLYRMYKAGNEKSLSTHMVKILREYMKDRTIERQSSASQQVVEVEASTPIDINNAFTDLDEAIDSLKPIIAKTIEVGVDNVCKQKNNRIMELEKEVRDLRTFKEEAKKSSVWAQLTQHLSRMA